MDNVGKNEERTSPAIGGEGMIAVPGNERLANQHRMALLQVQCWYDDPSIQFLSLLAVLVCHPIYRAGTYQFTGLAN